MKKLSIYNLEDLQAISNLPVKQAVNYLPLIKKDLILDEYSERVLKKFNNYFLNSSNIYTNMEETHSKNKKFNYLFMLSIPFLVIVLIASFYVIKPKISTDNIVKYTNTNVEHSYFYITETGKKYHLKNCRYIKNKNNIAKIKTNDEILKNYEPCSVCIK